MKLYVGDGSTEFANWVTELEPNVCNWAQETNLCLAVIIKTYLTASPPKV